MYGKHFSSMYEGSMYGAGANVFAVWGYCIANADPDLHTVRLNPRHLADILGENIDVVQDAIKYLCSPDENSCCTDYKGARLVNTSGFEYLVVSHAQYRDIKNNIDRREYMRKYMREYRGDDNNVKTVKAVKVNTFTPVSVSASEYDNKRKHKDYSDDFEMFWAVYPLKKEKKAAYKSWQKAIRTVDNEALIKAVKKYRTVAKPGFIKYPATWLNKGCWEDEYTVEKAQGNQI